MNCILLTIILLTSLIRDAHAEEVSKLSVKGTSLLKKEPNQAEILIGVIEEDQNAEAALRKTASKIQAIMNSLKERLNQEGSFFTEGISLYPVYEERDPKKPKPLAITGYKASSNLRIKTENLSLIGKLIDLASKAGANTIESLTFSLKDDRLAQEEALKGAVRNAMASAIAIAETADIKLKRFISIEEESGRMPIPYKTAFYAREAQDSFPIEPGAVEVSAQVSIVYEIE